MTPQLEEARRLPRLALRNQETFAVEFRYDDERILSISREALENLLSALIKQAGLLIGDAGHKP